MATRDEIYDQVHQDNERLRKENETLRAVLDDCRALAGNAHQGIAKIREGKHWLNPTLDEMSEAINQIKVTVDEILEVGCTQLSS